MFARSVVGKVATLALLALSASVMTASASDVVTLTVANFDETTTAATPAGDWFVEFYAPWCGHCKKLAPTWEKLATELKGKVNVAKVDVTENRDLGKRFGIKGFPTLLHIHDGAVYRYAGKRTVEDLVEFATGGYSKVSSTPLPAAAEPAQEL